MGILIEHHLNRNHVDELSNKHNKLAGAVGMPATFKYYVNLKTLSISFHLYVSLKFGDKVTN